ncbi:phage portal protein [Nitrospina watsonii]|uniref:Phage portal protein n=1 Tax=Nitrospina watsonii TaxID=1323948 RepID=A0ABN8W473_9BACT|nr:phage portal protein [Nitrospina watsonii]CAI2719747.1 Phage portal protein [Nitrospina watsonii]
MNITDWFQRKVSATTRALTLLMPLRPGSGLRGSYESLAREGYMQNSVVHACVKEIAEAAAGVPWSLYQRKADGDLEEVSAHPLLKLFDRPNPFQGKFELIERCVAHLYLSGNAYVEAVGPESRAAHAKTPPTELYALRPDRITILPDPTRFIRGYEYTVGGQTVRFAPEQVLHLKLFHPLDDWYGLSPVQVAALSVDKMNASDKWNAALLQNSAVPSGALVSKKRLTDEQYTRLKDEMRDQVQGIANARTPLLLEEDIEWKEIGLSPRDMDWIDGLRFSALQIAQIYNVPPELIGLQPATYSNRREARKALYTEVVLPVLARLRDAFNNWLLPRFGETLFLDYDADRIEALSEDRDSLWRRAVQSHFLTLNEKREMVGYDAVPDGNRVFLPQNLAALDDTAKSPPSDDRDPPTVH